MRFTFTHKIYAVINSNGNRMRAQRMYDGIQRSSHHSITLRSNATTLNILPFVIFRLRFVKYYYLLLFFNVKVQWPFGENVAVFRASEKKRRKRPIIFFLLRLLISFSCGVACWDSMFQNDCYIKRNEIREHQFSV